MILQPPATAGGSDKIPLAVGVGIEPTFRVFQTRANPSQLSDRGTLPMLCEQLAKTLLWYLRNNHQKLSGREGWFTPACCFGGSYYRSSNMTGKQGQSTRTDLRGNSA